MSELSDRELVFPIDVSSFTKDGFLGSAIVAGNRVDIEFDDKDDGVFLTREMVDRIGARKGSKLQIIVDTDERPQVAQTTVAGIQSAPKVSNAKVYYGVGRNGGAILRIRKP